MKFWDRLLGRESVAPPSPVAKRKISLAAAALKAREGEKPAKIFTIKAPELPPGVVPAGTKAPVMAMDGDGGWGGFSGYGSGFYYGAYNIMGFPGYQYLAGLSTRAEYRAFASALSTEMTREWITLNSSETDDDATKDKLTAIAKRLEDLGVQQIIQKACEQDAYFGHSQIFIDLGDKGRDTPLILSEKTILKKSLKRFTVVEPMWTTPNAYNAADPTAPDFYKPTSWFVLGKIIHSSRLLDICTRPLPDMLKPAFNFGGISLSQLAEPYVNNWLRTRQSVADLLNNFSITALATDMSQVLQDGDNGSSLFDRADLFTATRSNRGLMLLDMEREDLVQVNTPLSGLDELQAQAQEHMCAVSRIPAMILTGISPSGLNASSEGEIRAFYDWISAQQESYYRKALDTIIKIIQLDMFGEIDPDITFTFDPLYQMTPKELAEIRKSDADAANVYLTAGVIDPQEDRERLARDPQSNYQGLDLSKEIVDVNPDPEESDL